jgi:hypothetical protein
MQPLDVLPSVKYGKPLSKEEPKQFKNFKITFLLFYKSLNCLGVGYLGISAQLIDKSSGVWCGPRVFLVILSNDYVVAAHAKSVHFR